MAFADNLKAAMDMRGMNPLQLAAALDARGVSVLPVTIENWLSGKTQDPNMAYLVETARVLGVTIDSLLIGKDAPDPAAVAADVDAIIGAGGR